MYFFYNLHKKEIIRQTESRGKKFFSPPKVQDGSGVHHSSYSLDTGVRSQDEAAGT
jgi:hypothetical protein